MKANWKNRYNQMEDTRVGREMDQLVEFRIRLACVAFNETEGIGAVKIDRARDKIQEYLDREFNGDTPKFSTARRHNVIRGIERMNAAYEAIMSRPRRKKGSKKVRK